MATAQERFDAVSVNLNVALQDALSIVTSGETETLKVANAALTSVHAEMSAKCAQLQADYDALKASHEDALNRVATWAEGMVANIRQHVPSKG